MSIPTSVPHNTSRTFQEPVRHHNASRLERANQNVRPPVQGALAKQTSSVDYRVAEDVLLKAFEQVPFDPEAFQLLLKPLNPQQLQALDEKASTLFKTTKQERKGELARLNARSEVEFQALEKRCRRGITGGGTILGGLWGMQLQTTSQPIITTMSVMALELLSIATAAGLYAYLPWRRYSFTCETIPKQLEKLSGRVNKVHKLIFKEQLDKSRQTRSPSTGTNRAAHLAPLPSTSQTSTSHALPSDLQGEASCGESMPPSNVEQNELVLLRQRCNDFEETVRIKDAEHAYMMGVMEEILTKIGIDPSILIRGTSS